MTRQMPTQDELLESQAAHSSSKQSPRVRNRQAPSLATPVTKKASEYAGPSFNHSPAPANLPPPPFLSKLVPQDSPSKPPRNYMSDPIPSSPPLFDTNLDTSMQQKRLGRSRADESRNINSRAEHNLAMADSHRAEDTCIIAHNVKSAEGDQQRHASNLDSANSRKRQDVRSSSKPNPWIRDQVESQQISAAVSSSSLQRSHAQIAVPSTRKPAAPEPRRRKGKTSKATSAESAPRAILKRPSQASPQQPQQTGPQRGHSQTNRSKSESTYVPLQRQPLTSEACVLDSEQTCNQAELQEEELLRLQTSQLMSLLEIQPDNRVTSNSNERSGQENNPTSKDGIEADLRRLLRLGA